MDSTKATVFRVPGLEIHAAHACDLHCEGCTHLSHFGTRGIVTLGQLDAWCSAWNARLAPGVVAVVGGEPTLNPRLPDFVRAVRDYWPRASLQVFTNGFGLGKHETLPEVLEACRGKLFVSIHGSDPAYTERFREVEDRVARWTRRHPRLRVRWLQSVRHWWRPYCGDGTRLDACEEGDATASYAHCPEKRSLQLFEGRLWKCPAMAYLQLPEARVRASRACLAYADAYSPLAPTCDDSELSDFLRRGAEPCCAMCPAKPTKFTPRNPFDGDVGNSTVAGPNAS